MATRNDRQTKLGHYPHPGVYFEEIFPETPPGFRTGVPVFAGFVQSGKPGFRNKDEDAPKFYEMTRWSQFEERFHSIQKGAVLRPDGLASGGFLAYSVRGFFENGGERCWVVAIPMPTEGFLNAKAQLENLFKPGGMLEDLEDIDLVCVPDVMMKTVREVVDSAVIELQTAILEYCQRMGDRFAILDALPTHIGEHSFGSRLDREDLQSVIGQGNALQSGAGALYFPWLCVNPFGGRKYSAHHEASRQTISSGRAPDPTTPSTGIGILVPPCGHIAGIYAHTDTRVGIHKAPANERLEGVLDLEVGVADEDQDYLNDNAVGINCLRSFPGRGIRVWGARTLSRQAAWRYVNVRRLFLTLARWIDENMRDLVFEPNGPELWERVRYRLGAYCYDLFQRGALKGLSMEEAFFIKCDAETNPLAVREAGRLIAEVGLAPVSPAEFVIVRITQSVAGVNVAGPITFT